MVLRSAGFPVAQLLLWNFLASLTCLAGVGLVHVVGETDLAATVQRYTPSAQSLLKTSMTHILIHI